MAFSNFCHIIEKFMTKPRDLNSRQLMASNCESKLQFSCALPFSAPQPSSSNHKAVQTPRQAVAKLNTTALSTACPCPLLLCGCCLHGQINFKTTDYYLRVTVPREPTWQALVASCLRWVPRVPCAPLLAPWLHSPAWG